MPTTNNFMPQQPTPESLPDLRPTVDVVAELKRRSGTTSARCVYVQALDSSIEGTQTVLHFADPYRDAPGVVSLSSPNSAEEARAILDEIIPLRESFQILTALAQARAISAPLIIEGDTSVGKTYLVEKFTELVIGRGVKPIDFYCNKHTDASELMGKWVPRVKSAQEEQAWDTFLRTPYGSERLAALADEAETLAARPEMPLEQRRGILLERLKTLARESGVIGGNVEFDFQLGAAPKAFMERRFTDGRRTYEPGGPGNILHIEEVGLAQPGVVNALLPLRGSHGRLADSFQLYQDGGREIVRGTDTQLVFSTNPPEGLGYKSRNEVDAALAAACLWLPVAPLSTASLTTAAEYFTTYRLGAGIHRAPAQYFEMREAPELGKQIASLLAIFHEHYVSAVKNTAAGRIQQIPRTIRSFGQVAALLECVQAGDFAAKKFDVVATLTNAVDLVYLVPLQSDAATSTDLRTKWELLLRDATLGTVQFRGSTTTREAALRTLVEERAQHRPSQAAGRSSPRTDPRVAAVVNGL